MKIYITVIVNCIYHIYHIKVLNHILTTLKLQLRHVIFASAERTYQLQSVWLYWVMTYWINQALENFSHCVYLSILKISVYFVSFICAIMFLQDPTYSNLVSFCMFFLVFTLLTIACLLVFCSVTPPWMLFSPVFLLFSSSPFVLHYWHFIKEIACWQNVLKDLLPRQPELRLILMSATLNAELFSSYFGGAPMIHIPVSSELHVLYLNNKVITCWTHIYIHIK